MTDLSQNDNMDPRVQRLGPDQPLLVGIKLETLSLINFSVIPETYHVIRVAVAAGFTCLLEISVKAPHLCTLAIIFLVQESMNQNLEVVLSVSQDRLREHRDQVQRADPRGQEYEIIMATTA